MASAGRVGWTVQPAVPLGQDTSPRRVQRNRPTPRTLTRQTRPTIPRLGGGVGTSFLEPKLAVALLREAWGYQGSSFGVQFS
jgi:hypothetical protein